MSDPKTLSLLNNPSWVHFFFFGLFVWLSVFLMYLFFCFCNSSVFFSLTILLPFDLQYWSWDHWKNEQLRKNWSYNKDNVESVGFSANKCNGMDVLIHHLFPLVLWVVAVERLRGHRGTRFFLWSAEVENGLFLPADLQLVPHSQFDPVGEVLQWAVLEAVAGSEGFGRRERGPTLEDPVVGPDVLVHVWVDGGPPWALVSLLWRPQRWNILGKQTRAVISGIK